MKIEIEYQGKTREVETKEGKTALEILKENEIQVSAICGGSGICGKCRIRCLEANKISSDETLVFTSEEIEQGMRLACKAVPLKGSKIQVLQEEAEFEVLTECGINKIDRDKLEYGNRGFNKAYAIAIDIGTTTIAGILLEESADFSLASESRMNRQRSYGADVISRIQASNAGKKTQLQKCIQRDLREIIEKLIESTGIKKEELRKIALAGNTTMIHLLMGYSCETLGRFPFIPVNIEPIHGTCEELLGFFDLKSEVFILPGISAFVGGDITAGLLVTDFLQSTTMNLLIDLGTNGEMAVGNKHQLWVTSAAAGPAFEGGNITFGTGSIPGAVCHAKWTDGEMKLETIGNIFPITGICGTGALELLSELLEEGIVDQTGLMIEPYFTEGYPLGIGKSGEEIRFMQKDVRELQLAKAAIHAGIETLIEEASVSFDQFDSIYLAGGFGTRLDVNKAIRIGLLPKEFKDKVKTIGNSSLQGACLYAKQKERREQAGTFAAIAKEIVLAKIDIFQQKYLECMYFE